MNGGERILDGVRKRSEFMAVRPYIDLAIWVDYPNNPRDPTQQYGPELCDIILRNDPFDRSFEGQERTKDRIRNLVHNFRKFY